MNMESIYLKKSVAALLLISLNVPTLAFAQNASSTESQNASTTWSQSASTTEYLLALEQSTKSISERIKDKTAEERARIKSLEFKKLSFPSKETIKGIEVEIKEIVDIPGGIQLYVRAWKNKKPIGFGSDATIEWERLRFFNPPILARTNNKSTKKWTDEAGRTVSVTAYEYEENPRLALLQMVEDTIRIVGKDGSKIISGKQGHTTSTFYPDGDPESATVDGRTYFASANTTWSAIHDASVGGGAADNETSSANFSSVEATNASNVWNSIGRAYFLFNTSAIPDTDSVSAATFSVYVEGKSDSFTDAVALVDVNPASNIGIAAADYGQSGTTKQATNISISSITTSAYNEWTLNSFGKASIAKDGVTKFGLRSEMDRGNTPNWVSNGLSRIYGRYADYSGTTSDPKLVVTHSSTPIAPTVLQNLTYTYDASGNITRILDTSGTDTAKTVDYTYDDLNRMVTASSSGALYSNYIHAFNYDAIGNIASSTLASSSTLTGPTELYASSLFSDANLVAYYRFEGNSNDSKGSNNGTDTSMSYATSTGKFGQGAGFGGSSYIDLSSLPINSQNVTFSAIFWAKTATSTRQRWMDMGTCDGSITKDCFMPELYQSSPTGDFTAYGSFRDQATITDNVWHQIGYTVDGGSTYKLYVDGQLKDTKSTPGLRITNAGTTSKRIGKTADNFHGVNGAIDDVAIFNRVLTANEISTLFTGTVQFASSTTYTYGSSSYANPHAVTQYGSTTYSYDNNGNLTSDSIWNHTWNYRNRLTQSSSSNALVTYLYDFADSRVRMVSPSTTLIVASPNYSMENTTSTKHIFANGELVATVRGSGGSSTPYYVVTDHLGSAEKTVSASGTIVELSDYYPFGSVRQDAGTLDDRKSFIGKDLDSDTGLSQLEARYYKSNVGRFISQDPMFWESKQHLEDPQSLNSYGYAGNNPITFKDPTGRDYFELSFSGTWFGASGGIGLRMNSNGVDWFTSGGASLSTPFGGYFGAAYSTGDISHQPEISVSRTGKAAAGLGFSVSRDGEYDPSDPLGGGRNRTTEYALLAGGGASFSQDYTYSDKLFTWGDAPNSVPYDPSLSAQENKNRATLARQGNTTISSYRPQNSQPSINQRAAPSGASYQQQQNNMIGILTQLVGLYQQLLTLQSSGNKSP